MNRGAEELAAALTERGDQQRLSEVLKTSPGVVSTWVNGERTPSARFRGRLMDLEIERGGDKPPIVIKIRWELWDEAAQEPTGTDAA
jgi:hypothetical protein